MFQCRTYTHTRANAQAQTYVHGRHQDGSELRERQGGQHRPTDVSLYRDEAAVGSTEGRGLNLGPKLGVNKVGKPGKPGSPGSPNPWTESASNSESAGIDSVHPMSTSHDQTSSDSNSSSSSGASQRADGYKSATAKSSGGHHDTRYESQEQSFMGGHVSIMKDGQGYIIRRGGTETGSGERGNTMASRGHGKPAGKEDEVYTAGSGTWAGPTNFRQRCTIVTYLSCS